MLFQAILSQIPLHRADLLPSPVHTPPGQKLFLPDFPARNYFLQSLFTRARTEAIVLPGFPAQNSLLHSPFTPARTETVLSRPLQRETAFRSLRCTAKQYLHGGA